MAIKVREEDLPNVKFQVYNTAELYEDLYNSILLDKSLSLSAKGIIGFFLKATETGYTWTSINYLEEAINEITSTDEDNVRRAFAELIENGHLGVRENRVQVFL